MNTLSTIFDALNRHYTRTQKPLTADSQRDLTSKRVATRSDDGTWARDMIGYLTGLGEENEVVRIAIDLSIDYAERMRKT